MIIGQTIKEQRKKRGVRQNVMAKEIGITQTYLSLIENERRKASIEVIETISAYFKMPVAYLCWLSLTEDDINPEKRYVFHRIKPALDAMIESII